MLLRAAPQPGSSFPQGVAAQLGSTWSEFRDVFPEDDRAFLPENADDVMRAAAGIALEERRQKQLEAARLKHRALAKGRERAEAERSGDVDRAERAAREEAAALRASEQAEQEAARDSQVAEAASKPEDRMVS